MKGPGAGGHAAAARPAWEVACALRPARSCSASGRAAHAALSSRSNPFVPLQSCCCYSCCCCCCCCQLSFDKRLALPCWHAIASTVSPGADHAQLACRLFSALALVLRHHTSVAVLDTASLLYTHTHTHISAHLGHGVADQLAHVRVAAGRHTGHVGQVLVGVHLRARERVTGARAGREMRGVIMKPACSHARSCVYPNPWVPRRAARRLRSLPRVAVALCTLCRRELLKRSIHAPAVLRPVPLSLHTLPTSSHKPAPRTAFAPQLACCVACPTTPHSRLHRADLAPYSRAHSASTPWPGPPSWNLVGALCPQPECISPTHHDAIKWPPDTHTYAFVSFFNTHTRICTHTHAPGWRLPSAPSPARSRSSPCRGSAACTGSAGGGGGDKVSRAGVRHCLGMSAGARSEGASRWYWSWLTHVPTYASCLRLLPSLPTVRPGCFLPPSPAVPTCTGLVPAATIFMPSAMKAADRTVAVVVPSPAVSLVRAAACGHTGHGPKPHRR